MDAKSDRNPISTCNIKVRFVNKLDSCLILISLVDAKYS